MTEFIAHQMASMIQNISQNRGNKAITIEDLKNIVSAAYLSLYPGTTMFRQGKGHVYCHFPHPHIYCVKGNDDGTASCVWRVQLSTAHSKCTAPSQIDIYVKYDDCDFSPVRFLKNTAPKNIYPTLRIKPGEMKIIVEANIFLGSSNYTDINGINQPFKKQLGLYLTEPKVIYSPVTAVHRTSFNSVVIFSPRPGLFSETAPQ